MLLGAIIQGIEMKVFDKKIITLNNGEKDVDILVYIKKVDVKNNCKNIKAVCRITGD